MLVLARRVGESVLIGEDIWVTVNRIDRNQVRIGFDAPTDVVIMRTELLDREDDFSEDEDMEMIAEDVQVHV